MQALTEAKQSAVPVAISERLEHQFRLVANKVDPALSAGETRYAISADYAPSVGLRQALDQRLNDLDRWLSPAGPDRTAAELDLMFAVMGKPDADPSKAKLIVMGYIKALMDLPAFALSASFQSFITGQTGDGKWAPKPGEIRIEAQKRLSAMAKERREINAVLTARILPPSVDESRKKAALAAARAMMPMMQHAGREAENARANPGFKPTPPPPLMTPEDHLVRAAEIAAQPMPQLSEETRRKFGFVQAQQAAE